MKKVGILTLNGNVNVGNRLQNYALKVVVEKMGFNVSSIWFIDIKERIKHYIKILFPFRSKFRQYSKFSTFSSKNLNIKYYINNNIGHKYDYFIVGSDQVWNYTFDEFSSDYFLSFSPKNKNISYAASIGVGSLPTEMKDFYKNGINNLKNISVREDNAKKLLNELSSNNIEVVLDPTMLLTTEEWEKIALKPKKFKTKKYIFTYFLGEINNDRWNEIEKFASKNDCDIINFFDLFKKKIFVGPREFLYLEKNAYLVCTDSFHSSVFSILFNRPFVIFDREQVGVSKMNSRLDTLIKKFKLNNRKFNKCITEENLECDYSEAYEILEVERNKSIEFLLNSLEVKR